MVRHEAARVAVVPWNRDTTGCSANRTLSARASLATAECEAAETMYPHSERKVAESQEETTTTSSKVVMGLGLRGMVNVSEPL